MPALVKELMMKEVADAFEKNPYAFISTFNGLTVAEMSEFRRAIEKVANRSLVIKHALAKKIFQKRNLGDGETVLKDSVVVTFGDRDPQVVSKALVDFAKAHEKLVPSGVVFEDQLYGQDFVKRLAQLPSRKELLTQMVVRAKSPITGFVLTLNALVRGLAVVLNEVKKQKEVQPA